MRNEKDCNGVVFGADAVIHCAASLKPNGDKSRGDDAGGRLLEEAGRLFEFRLPRVDRVKAASAGEGSADVEGAEFLARALSKSLARERPKPDRPLAFILLSGRSTAGDGPRPGAIASKRPRRDEQPSQDWPGAQLQACEAPTG